MTMAQASALRMLVEQMVAAHVDANYCHECTAIGEHRRGCWTGRFVAFLAAEPATTTEAAPRPTHTAGGEEILGWSKPVPSRPIVRAKMRPIVDHPDD